MAKFPLYIALCVSLIYYSLATAANPRLEILGEGEYAIYSREDIRHHLIDKKISSGIGFIYYTNSANAVALRTQFDNIDGESIMLRGLSAKEVFKKLGYSEVSASGDMYCGYSPRGLTFIKNGQKKINLQVVERANSVVVGWPVILGSY